MPDRPTRCRPASWNSLLRKGHAHVTSHGAARATLKSTIDDDIETYWQDSTDTDEIGTADNSHPTARGKRNGAAKGRSGDRVSVAHSIPLQCRLS
jgi:hypothetical protein